MAFDPLTAILTTVHKGLDKFLPDKMGEAEKLTIEDGMKRFIVEEASKENSDFRSFMLQYEGAAKDVGPIITFIRGIIRPLLTITISGAYMWGWLHPDKFQPEQMLVLKPAVLIVLIFWFGDRALQKSGLLEVFKKK